MSVSSEIMEFMKQTLLPEIAEIKTDLAEFKMEMREEHTEIKSELKVIHGRLVIMDKRFDEAQGQRNSLRDDLREIRSYVWSGGRETGHMIHEAQSEYKTGDREG